MIISSNRVRVSRIGLNHDEQKIKSAKHRSLIAELNQDYEGYTPDFFELAQNNNGNNASGSLGVLILNINPPLSSDHYRMLDLRVVVPFTNLNGYHYNKLSVKS